MGNIDKFFGKKGNLVFLLVVLFVFSVFAGSFFPAVSLSPGAGGVNSNDSIIFIFMVSVVAVGAILLLKYKKKI